MPTPLRAAHPIEPSVLDRLKAIVGEGGYIEDAKDLEGFTSSWRDDWKGAVPLLLRPKSTAEVAALVKVCAETRTPIVPQGGNTGLTGASQPHADMSEVIISTSRMNKVREIDTANDTLTVEPGVVLQDIQRIAAENDRLFPLSLGAEGSCQIGGNISTNAGGTQVLRYGNTRALVLGLEVVLANGEIWNGLRGLRKDNTGYDLKHLFIGAEGTLGIVTAAVLRLFPLPTATETAWIALESPEAAVELLGFLKSRLGEQVSGFELLQRSIVDLVLEHIPGSEDPIGERYPWYVLTEVSGQGEPGSLSEPFTDALGEAAEKGLIQDAAIASSGAQSKRFWQMREDMAEAQKRAGPSIKHDVSVPVSKIPTFLRQTAAALNAAYPGINIVTFGHVGDGNMHYNPVAPEGWTRQAFAGEREKVNRIVHDLVISHDGSISAEHGVGRLRLEENMHYKSPVEIELMRTIKRSLDPDNIMNPGKMIRL
ncbi:MAG: FAD-binding oxidoreductase [Alphaproteobacteria bacterium]|nr:FAD-binding oxidoreductase [Alphaproteobacteria bacterium]